MTRPNPRFLLLLTTALLPGASFSLHAQATPPYDRADSLRGSIGPGRSWWDVTFYDLEVTVNPADSTIRGRTGMVYTVTGISQEMQIDLQRPLVVDSVVRRGVRLPHRRDGDVVMVAVPPARRGAVDTVTVFYHGRPRVAPNAPWEGGLVWATDSLGHRWVATANQGLGASVWWPNKDTQADEPDSQRIAITVPPPMVNVSNGRLRSVTAQPGGAIRWEWFVGSPINNYNVTVNAGAYTHFADTIRGEGGVLTLDYWPLAHHEADARRQWVPQVPDIVACFEDWFGPFPWYDDGLKVVETPYLGMEHQSAVAYGNGFANGYLGRDLSGTGLGLEWDFILVHELAHEWWGNSLTTADLADMWVHESFANYAEAIYTECRGGREAGARYARGVRDGILNDRPIIPAYDVNAEGSGDMYNKGGTMLHMIRQIVNDDGRWRGILRGLQAEFRHSVITGRRVREYMSEAAGVDLQPVFRQYLETADVPVLEYRIRGNNLQYRWANVIPGFDMPVDVRLHADRCTRLRPTSEWNPARIAGPAAFGVDRDWYVRVRDASGVEAVATADCPDEEPAGPAALPGAQRAFWSALRTLCGKAFRGEVREAPPGDTSFAGVDLVMHVRECDDDVIRIPFHVGEDRSRTWVLTRTADGLRLKHDHRHEDGTEDEVTQYGGDTAGPGTPTRQEYPADAHTASLIPAARTNVWTVEVVPGRRFVYALRREGTDRRFRIEFDLTREVDSPPPPWGW